MYVAERMFLRGHKNHFWILCHGIYTKDLGYVRFYTITSLQNFLTGYGFNGQPYLTLIDLIFRLFYVNSQHFMCNINRL